MNADFHYYAAYCASLIAGYSNNEAEKIAYSSCFVDFCTHTLLKKCGAPISATTTQSLFELADFKTDIFGLREITRIWSSFHFLPGDLYAPVKKGGRNYKSKYRLICKPNSQLLIDTVNLAKNSSLEAIGIAMHVLTDTWAHQNFAGTPSLVINDTNTHIYEILNGKECQINLSPNPKRLENIDEHKYQNSMYMPSENSVMNIGHGRIGHIADLSFIKYKYMPAWDGYNEIIKDNPSDFMKAFCQMVYALKYFRNENSEFKLNEYDPINKYKKKVEEILSKRQLTSEKDWKEFACELAGATINDFDDQKYVKEYTNAKDRSKTDFNSFISHAVKQKKMVTSRIVESKNRLAGYSIDKKRNPLKKLEKHIDHRVRAFTDNLINKSFKNFKSLLLILIGILIFVLPSPDDFLVVCYLVGTIITAKGFIKFIYYLTSARHMIGGGKIFINSFLLMDLGLLAFLVLLIKLSFGLYYIVGILGIYGFIDIIRSFELKKYRYKTWLFKLLQGLLIIAVGVICPIFLKDQDIILLIASITCVILGIVGIIKSFTKSMVEYIPEI
ncbi:MAG: hypothetical protein MJ213_01735 [Bacilli bacterium]|nr:hypothetical protein [Bacilli bacterium]